MPDTDEPDRLLLYELRRFADLLSSRPDTRDRFGPRLQAEDFKGVQHALELHPEFGQPKSVFALGGHLQFQLHPHVVAQTLSRAMAGRDPESALLWLRKVRRLEGVAVRRCAELFGVQPPPSPITFSNGVTMLSVHDLKSSSWQSEQAKASASSYNHWTEPLSSRGTVVYQVTNELLSSEVRAGDSNPWEDLEDVALGLSIASSETNATLGTAWVELEDPDLLDAIFGWAWRPLPAEGRLPFSSREATPEDIEWVEKFLALRDDTREVCSVAAMRLNLGRRRLRPGDQAIELSTAFEALLGRDNERAELTYRFALRAALLLEAGLDQRKATSRMLKALYSLRGKVVHGDSSGNSRDDAATVSWAEQACSRLLQMFVAKGRLPDMSSLELSGGSILYADG